MTQADRGRRSEDAITKAECVRASLIAVADELGAYVDVLIARAGEPPSSPAMPEENP